MRRSMWVLTSGALFFSVTLLGAEWVESRAVGDYASGSGGDASLHALAMTTVFALVCTSATLLLRAGWVAAAVFVAAGAAVAPLALLAPPLSPAAALSTGDLPSVTIGLRMVVGASAVAWIVATAMLASGRRFGRGAGIPRLSYEVASFGVPLTVIVLALLLVPGALSDPGHEDLGSGLAMGWALLAAGVVAAGLAAVRAEANPVMIRALIALPLLSVSVVGAMYVAYNNTGGRPAVAGWSFATAPIYATVTTSVVLIVGGLSVMGAYVISRISVRASAAASVALSGSSRVV